MFAPQLSPATLRRLFVTAAWLASAGPALAGGTPYCTASMNNALQNGATISIKECSDSNGQRPFSYDIQNTSSFSLVAFAVSTTASPSVSIYANRAGWDGRYVSKSDWGSEFGNFGSFESFFGPNDLGAAYFSTTVGGPDALAPNSSTVRQFYIDAWPASEFVALAGDGNVGMTVVAQSLPLSPVPELPAYALMGAGLLGLAGLQRARTRRANQRPIKSAARPAPCAD